ncbi:sigma-70 family RNA polymerase sigma factor [Lentibacillus salicampi]|nr:sigma-70 family RNA polymerase sigma factor [Lentibacillus salicampi]
MEGEQDECIKKFQAFKQSHPKFFQQPIIKSFLQDEVHFELVKQAICSPTQQKVQRVNEAFQSHYGEVRALTYLSNSIYFNAINFDKNRKKHHEREALTLDQPLHEDSKETTHKDMLYHPNPNTADMTACETISDYIEEPQLYQAIQTLTPKQKDILTHKYVHELRNNEMADLFDDSPQNVSKLHRKALQKLEKHLKKGQDNYDHSS